MNKQVFIFLFFLLLSGVFWLMMTLNESYERELKIPILVTGIPRNVVLTSPAVDTMRVTMNDKGWQLLSYLYGDRLRPIEVPYKNYDRGNGAGIIPSSDIKRLLMQQLEQSTKVSSVKPDRMEFFYNNGERKLVPIHWSGRVIPDQLYFLSHVHYDPDSIEVYASEETLDSIRFVTTEPLNYAGFRDTLRVECRVNHPSGIKVVPERVHITFCTDVLTEESISIPVECINLPEGKVLRTFPARVKVLFVTGVSQIRFLRTSDFRIVADYNEIIEKPSDKCNIYLRTVPQGISRPRLATRQVDYLIEEE